MTLNFGAAEYTPFGIVVSRIVLLNYAWLAFGLVVVLDLYHFRLVAQALGKKRDVGGTWVCAGHTQ